MFVGSAGLFAELKQTLPQEGVAGAEAMFGSDDDDDNETENSVNEETFDEDAMMMEMMMEESASPGNDSAGKSQKPGKQKKWGRKGRKVRNQDPYGMFASPDDILGQEGNREAPPVGVSVKGGKHGRKGYTRQTGYGSNRAID